MSTEPRTQFGNSMLEGLGDDGYDSFKDSAAVAGMGAASDIISSLGTSYTAEQAGVPFQMMDNASRRDRDRLQRQVDQYNKEWEEKNLALRNDIETQKQSIHEKGMQAKEYETETQSILDRFQAVQRRMGKEEASKQRIQETSDRIRKKADEDDVLKDHLISNWGGGQ